MTRWKDIVAKLYVAPRRSSKVRAGKVRSDENRTRWKDIVAKLYMVSRRSLKVMEKNRK